MRRSRTVSLIVGAMVTIGALAVMGGTADALPPATLSGQVTSASAGLGISGATVYAYGPYAVIYGQTTTGPGGTYQLSLPQGNYRLRFDAPGYHRAYSGGSTWVASTQVFLPSGATTTYNQALTPTSTKGTLAGVVTDAWKHTPAAGMQVRAYGGAYAVLYGQTTTAADGSYRLELPAGTFRVRFDHPTGFYNRVYSGPSPTWVGSGTVRLFTGWTTTLDMGMQGPKGIDCTSAIDGTSSDISFTDMSGKDLHGCDLHETVAAGAIFNGANLRGTNMRSAMMVADLTNADATGADFREAMLGTWWCTNNGWEQAGAITSGLIVDGATFEDAVIWNYQYSGMEGSPTSTSSQQPDPEDPWSDPEQYQSWFESCMPQGSW